MTKAAVLGSGSWGTAFAAVLADAGTEVVLWAKDAALAESIMKTRQNASYHPGIELPESLQSTSDIQEALVGADFVVLAIPSTVLRENLDGWTPMLEPDAVVVSLIKGIESATCKRMSEVVRDVTGLPEGQVAVVSGPNLAREIMQRQPAATVVACADEDNAERLQQACLTSYFRPYTNQDVVGVELGGAVKNVIALANGMAAGMGFGENTQASLITRGLAEITRLGLALGAQPQTFAGLAGLGDLVATCSSPLSRNRTFGENLGRGLSVAEATSAMKQTCEGVKSCRSIRDLARELGVEMPITEVVVGAVHDGLSPRQVARALMERGAKSEDGTA